MSTTTTTDSARPELKHLGLLRVAAIQSLLLVSSLYDYVMRNAGPLRSVFGSVEGTAKSVLGPFCHKYKNFPDHVLVFADQKVDEATHQFDKHAPPVSKKAARRIHILIDAIAEKGRKLLSEIETGGPVAGFHYAVSEFKRTSISLIAIVYVAADGFKPFHTLIELVIPIAGHWSEKYNKLVISTSRKGNKIFSFVPQIPIDEISRACKKQRASKVAQNGSTEHKEKSTSSSSDSD